MRRGVLTRLVLLALAAPILVHNAAYAEKGSKQQAPEIKPHKGEVEGKARTDKQEAIDSALESAANEIAAFLREQKPALIWKPDAAYVRERLLQDTPQRQDWTQEQLDKHTILVKTTEFNVDGKPFTYQVRVSYIVDSQELAHMRQLDQPYRDTLQREAVQHRQIWLGKILLGVVALLTAISGYIRLEDATKGYYTGWLRLGLVGVLCAVVAGLLMVG